MFKMPPLNGHPLVSVVIPTYNRVSMLREAIASVKAQDYPGGIDIIVVDGNSPDGTAAMVTAEFPEIRLIRLEKNLGPCRARNRALSLTKGQYLAFLDDDDLWEKDHLSRQIAHIRLNPRSFTVSDVVLRHLSDGSQKIVEQAPNLRRFKSIHHHFLVQNFIHCPACVLIPRHSIQEAGCFDEEEPLGSDWDLYLKLILEGYRPVFTGTVTAVKRILEKNRMTQSENLPARLKARLRRVDKYYPRVANLAPDVSRRAVLARIHADYARKFYRKGFPLRGLFSRTASIYYSFPR